MNFFSIRKLLAMSAMALTVAAVPGTASAGGSIHLDIPGFSIGFHDDHRYRKRHRHYKSHKRYKRYKRHYRNHDSYDYYPRRSYRYYDGYRSNRYDRRRYRDRDRYESCPTPGYSSRYYRDRGCYSHGDHYHCDD